MKQISYYKKPSNGQYPYNYIHNNSYAYPPYGPYFHKKNYYKNKTKSNISMNNNYNNYLEEYEYKRSSYYNNNNNFNYFNNNNLFNIKNRYNYYSHRYNTNYFIEEKKISEEINNDSANEEDKKEEILKIRINVSEGDSKELVIFKEDDVRERVEEFCKENNIREKLIEPLYNKVNKSLNALEIINNMSLNKNDFFILNKIKDIRDNSNDE